MKENSRKDSYREGTSGDGRAYTPYYIHRYSSERRYIENGSDIFEDLGDVEDIDTDEDINIDERADIDGNPDADEGAYGAEGADISEGTVVDGSDFNADDYISEEEGIAEGNYINEEINTNEAADTYDDTAGDRYRETDINETLYIDGNDVKLGDDRESAYELYGTKEYGERKRASGRACRRRRRKKSFIEEVNLKQLAVLIVFIIAVITLSVFGIRSCMRNISGDNGTSKGMSAATPSVPATVSEAERKARERRALEDRVIAEYNDLGIVKASGYINMRSEPDSVDMTNIIGKLPENAACDILQTDGEWSLVKSGGIQAYVNNTYLATGDEAKEIARELIKERAVVTVPKLNIRTEPVIDPENVVGSALNGERYEVISNDGEWAKIVADKIDGVDEAFISISDGNAEIRECMDEAKRLDLREMVLTQFDNIVVSNTDGYVNIRETPEDLGIDNICGKFPEEAGAELLETVENDGRTWYKIKSGSVTGYIAAEYMITGQAAREKAVEEAVLTAVVATDALNVRTEPSLEAEAWTQVTKNQEYHVLDQLDGWVEIELDNSDGDEEADRAFISTRDNNVEVRYGLTEAVEYYPAVEAANAAAAFRNEIVNYACKFVGNPYVWGGTSLTNGADCSGFVQSVLKNFGISVPRVSRDQAKAGTAVTSAEMKPGDLVFYANSSGTINHVGMYIGNGQVVNAASRRSGIRIYRWNYRTPVAIRNVIGP